MTTFKRQVVLSMVFSIRSQFFKRGSSTYSLSLFSTKDVNEVIKHRGSFVELGRHVRNAIVQFQFQYDNVRRYLENVKLLSQMLPTAI